MRKVRLVLVFVLLTLLASSPLTTALAQSGSDLDQIDAQLAALEPYVHFASDGASAFDAQSARRDGFSEDIVLLAEEIVAFQNEMAEIAAASDVDSVERIAISLEQYPRLRQLFELASQRPKAERSLNGAGGVQPLGVHACGTYSNPVPNYNPPWYTYGPYSDPEGTLLSWGFHHTAWYACGQVPPYDCPNDFTRGRGYYGPYGYCSSPRFRDQGRTDGSAYFYIQFGEPNPEVYEGSWPSWWPYWYWDAYVLWWHQYGPGR